MEKEKIKSFIKTNIVPIIFIIMCISMIMISGVGLNFLANELYRRIIRNTIMIIALLIPIMAGMGINFSIIIGALCTHFAAIIIIDRQIDGAIGVISVFVLAQIIAFICGNIIGYILNKAKGREMITSIVIGLLGTSIYTLVFLAGYGTIIKPHNPSIMLSTGIGVQTMIDLMPLKEVIVENPYIPIVFIVVATFITKYLMGTQFGVKLKAIGDNMNNAYSLGIDVDKMRRYAIVVSTMLASASQLMFILNIGSINVYTGHLNVDVFACASILAGGATLNKASLKNVFLGVILFHTMFIVSPMAGKVLFSNVAIGEYFRSFVAYSTIIISLMINIYNEKEEELS
ncbi:ABC transporter permease subunit [Peptacetobacter sp.]|uniref:ABC transporter permease subunit n=1 Tax=Peptacetobacter sp. TaxID=2991975 RepID=UPI00262D4355|nr:ABC transporter permease [Peptacetobacter sp.]